MTYLEAGVGGWDSTGILITATDKGLTEAFCFLLSL